MTSRSIIMLFENVSNKDKDIVFVYTSCNQIEDARKLGLSAVKKKLAISADYWLINSIYPWNKVIQEGEQYLMMFATQRILSDTLMKHIEAEHPYSVPVVIKSDMTLVNQPYSFWVDNTLSDKSEYVTETELEIKNKEERGQHYQRLK